MGPDLSEAGAGAIIVLILGLVALGSLQPLRLAGLRTFLEVERPSHASNSTAVSPVDLNASDTKSLTALPGIGPVIAERIVEHRRRHGAFVRIEDLLAVRGIGPAKLAKIQPRVRLGSVPDPQQYIRSFCAAAPGLSIAFAMYCPAGSPEQRFGKPPPQKRSKR